MLLKWLAPLVPLANRLPRNQRDYVRNLLRPLLVPRAPRVMRDPTLPLRGLPGINLFGLLDSPSGVGEGARATQRALQSVDVPHSVINLRKEHLFQGQTLESFAAPYCVNLFHLNADILDFGIQAVGVDTLHQRINLAHWAWELDRFPADWDHLFATLDEVWVCSRFVEKGVVQRTDKPVVCIPYSLEPPDDLRSEREEFGIPLHRPMILSVFDVASYPERKNPWACIQAFETLQNHPSRPLLVVKAGGSDVQPEVLQQLRKAIPSDNLILIDRMLDRSAIWRLLDCCDIFLSLHRSEGFGLLLAEAMLLGKFVVATDYSGNRDFMNCSNSFPIGYTLQSLSKDVGPYRAGNHWAEPNIDEAVKTLQVILDSPLNFRHIGTQAASDIRERLSPYTIGQQIISQMRLLGVAVR